MKSRKIGGVRIDFGLTYEEVVNSINSYIKSNNSHYIWTINPEFVMAAQKNGDFKKLLNESELSIPDGVGLLFANKYLQKVESFKKGFFYPIKAFLYGTLWGFSSLFKKKDLGTRITGADLIIKVCENAQTNGQTILLLGGWEKDNLGRAKKTSGKVAEKAATNLQKLFPKLIIVGASSEFKRAPADDKRTLNYIHEKMGQAKIDFVDIVFVGYNHIYQEKWLERNLAKIPGRVGLGVGGTLDFIAGVQNRSPEGFIKKDLEWLYRLLIYPWRIGRIFRAFPAFPLFVYYLSVKKPINH